MSPKYESGIVPYLNAFLAENTKKNFEIWRPDERRAKNPI
jgi:hypothetical protein